MERHRSAVTELDARAEEEVSSYAGEVVKLKGSTEQAEAHFTSVLAACTRASQEAEADRDEALDLLVARQASLSGQMESCLATMKRRLRQAGEQHDAGVSALALKSRRAESALEQALVDLDMAHRSERHALVSGAERRGEERSRPHLEKLAEMERAHLKDTADLKQDLGAAKRRGAEAEANAVREHEASVEGLEAEAERAATHLADDISALKVAMRDVEGDYAQAVEAAERQVGRWGLG